MPTHPERIKATKARIVEAAVQLFSQRGFKGTSTRQIALRAGVNEATIFRYFSKKSLFLVAVDVRLTRLKMRRELLDTLAADREPALVLQLIFEFLMTALIQDPQLMRLLCVGTFEVPAAEQVYRKHLGLIFDPMKEYLARCAARGKIAAVDPELIAFSFTGTVIAHNVLNRQTEIEMPRTAIPHLSGAYASLWLRVLRPDARG